MTQALKLIVHISTNSEKARNAYEKYKKLNPNSKYFDSKLQAQSEEEEHRFIWDTEKLRGLTINKLYHDEARKIL